MASIDTIKKLCEFIWELEKKYDLLDLQLNGVWIWQFLRITIYYEIGQKIGLIEKPHTYFSASKKKYRKYFSLAKSSLLHNPFLRFQKIDAYIFEHERHKKVNGEKVDIYTIDIKEKLKKEGHSFTIVEPPCLGNHYKTKKHETSHSDFLLILIELIKKCIRVKFHDKDIELIEKLENEINGRLKIEYNLKRLFSLGIKKFKAQYNVYSTLFSQKKIKSVYTVVAYGEKGGMIWAAKNLGIKVYEIQHGVYSRYHLGYSYPHMNENLKYLPDMFLTWGGIWGSMETFPLRKDQIEELGFKYFEKSINRYKKVAKIPGQIAVISQGVLGPRIADMILAKASFFKNKRIIYKLHPGEYDRWENYSSLVKLNEFPNVQVVKDVDLYQLLAQSEYQIGVFSTAIYEGLSLGCKTFLLELPGIEYMEDLIKANRVTLIKSDREIYFF